MVVQVFEDASYLFSLYFWKVSLLYLTCLLTKKKSESQKLFKGAFMLMENVQRFSFGFVSRVQQKCISHLSTRNNSFYLEKNRLHCFLYYDIDRAGDVWTCFTVPKLK